MIHRIRILWAALPIACLLPQVQADDVRLLRRSVVDSGALTFARGDQTGFSTHVNGRTHQQNPLVTHRGFQYTIYYNRARHVCAGRRRLPAGEWDVIEFEDYIFENSDSHNTAVMGICEGDGTIHLAFDHHVSELHYRVSELGVADHPEEVAWSTALFKPVTAQLGSVGRIEQVTYPRFFSAPDGNLMFSYREVTSGNGNSMLQEYDGTTHDWTPGLGRFVARDIGEYTRDGETSRYRCAYMNNLMYAGKRLHASWVWRDRFKKTSVRNQHDLCYAYSDDDGRTWRNNKGSVIGETGTSRVIHIDTPGLVVAPIERELRPSNQNGQFAYPDGSIHVVMLHAPEKGERSLFHHYWRRANGEWNSQALSFFGGRPKLLGDRDGHLFLFYETGDAFSIAKGVPDRLATRWEWAPIYAEESVEVGSEAVVDFTRWQKERVVSAYMQEKPDELLSYENGPVIDGKPSALWVIDYQVSEYAACPEPAADAVQVPVDTALKWVAGMGAKAHRLYVGIDADRIARAKTSSSEFMGEFQKTAFSFPKALRPGTVFYWRVDEVFENNTIKTGTIWTFTTAE